MRFLKNVPEFFAKFGKLEAKSTVNFFVLFDNFFPSKCASVHVEVSSGNIAEVFFPIKYALLILKSKSHEKVKVFLKYHLLLEKLVCSRRRQFDIFSETFAPKFPKIVAQIPKRLWKRNLFKRYQNGALETQNAVSTTRQKNISLKDKTFSALSPEMLWTKICILRDFSFFSKQTIVYICRRHFGQPCRNSSVKSPIFFIKVGKWQKA